MPYGERSHKFGILESYQEMFGVTEKRVIIKFLNLLSGDQSKYRGDSFCLCGSMKKSFECHGPLLLTMFRYGEKREFQRDLSLIKKSFNQKG
jgi:hypothetical protein